METCPFVLSFTDCSSQGTEYIPYVLLSMKINLKLDAEIQLIRYCLFSILESQQLSALSRVSMVRMLCILSTMKFAFQKGTNFKFYRKAICKEVAVTVFWPSAFGFYPSLMTKTMIEKLIRSRFL